MFDRLPPGWYSKEELKEKKKQKELLQGCGYSLFQVFGSPLILLVAYNIISSKFFHLPPITYWDMFFLDWAVNLIAKIIYGKTISLSVTHEFKEEKKSEE